MYGGYTVEIACASHGAGTGRHGNGHRRTGSAMPRKCVTRCRSTCFPGRPGHRKMVLLRVESRLSPAAGTDAETCRLTRKHLLRPRLPARQGRRPARGLPRLSHDAARRHHPVVTACRRRKERTQTWERNWSSPRSRASRRASPRCSDAARGRTGGSRETATSSAGASAISSSNSTPSSTTRSTRSGGSPTCRSSPGSGGTGASREPPRSSRRSRA